MCDDVFLIMKYLSTTATAEQLKQLLLQHLRFRTDFVFHLSLYVRCNILPGVQSCMSVLFEPKVLRFFALRSFWLLRDMILCLVYFTVETICSMFRNFLGAFAKLRKATLSFVMPACLSVRPHVTTRLPLQGFAYHFVFGNFFENLSIKFKFQYNLTRITGICVMCVFVWVF